MDYKFNSAKIKFLDVGAKFTPALSSSIYKMEFQIVLQ